MSPEPFDLTDDELDAWLDADDAATIAITDDRGRFLFELVKEAEGDEWFIPRHVDVYAQRFDDHPLVARDAARAQPRKWLVALPDGRRRLDVPGPPIFWEKLPPVLDRLAERHTRLTVAALRAAVAAAM